MSSYLWLLFVVLTALCWGAYGPAIHDGQVSLKNPWKAFLFVGLAYFVIAVVIPLVILKLQGAEFDFTTRGVVASSVAGVLGALGALFVIGSMKAGGNPLYVMPLVFGLAPLVNVATSWAMHPPKGAVSPMLFVGFLVLAAGAGMVLYYKPS